MHRIAIDYENNADEFWENFSEAAKSDANFPDILRPLDPQNQDNTDEILTEDTLAFGIAEEYVSNIEGWSDGPSHAETALLFISDY